MQRRKFLSLLVSTAAVAGPLAARAQPAGKIYRVGFMGNSTADLEANLVGPFRQGLHDLGYEEGHNLVIEYRWADGDYDRFPALVAELLALNVDVIVTAGTPAALAVKNATTTVPLVMVAVGDPVGTGLVASLARPGGNATGLSSIAPDLEGKRLELLQEVIPALARVAVFWNPLNPFHAISLQHARNAAKVLHIELHAVAVRTTDELKDGFANVIKQRPEAILVLADRVFLHDRTLMMDFAAQHHLPGVYPYRELVVAGGLMSFGPNYADMHRRAARFVDKILKGAKPADLPVEQPTRFEFIINLKAAKALAIDVSPIMLARADEVIE
jgi:putative ABC transport system substrate-binding protein